MVLLKGDRGRSFLGLLALSILMSGCTVTREVGDFADRDGGPVLDATNAVDSEPGEVEPSQLENPDGWWLVFAQDRQCIYEVGDPLENVVRSSYVMQIRREEGGASFLRQRVRMCAHELSPLQFGFVSVVEAGMLDVQPTHDVAGFLLGAETGSAYVSGEIVDSWGLEGLPADATLPTEIDDPRVVDQDQDGQPGVSVTVTFPDGAPVCSVRLVERIRTALEGRVINGRRIEGKLFSHIQQVVLSTDAHLCGNGALGPSLAEKGFHMVRIDGKQGGPNLDANRDGTLDCDEVRSGLDGVLAFYEIPRLEPESEENCP